MSFDKAIYDHGRLHGELIEALGTYRQLQFFSEDEDAIRAHLNGRGRPKKMSDTGQIEGVTDRELERFLEPVSESIETAIANYRRQLLVIIVSIVETSISDAFTVLFTFRPEAIKGLTKDPSGDSFTPSVKMDELMNATNLDDLRESVVERSVAFACQGKNKKTVLRRLVRLFGTEIPAVQIAEILELVEFRNRIVHDNLKREVTTLQVETAFDVAMSFIREVGKMVSAHQLPIFDPLEVCG